MYTEEDILASATPFEYIDRCLKSKVGRGRKIYLAQLWMERTGYTNTDIMYARHRHPVWKKKKQKGNVERTRKRLDNYPMYNVMTNGKGYRWHPRDVEKIYELNRKNRDGSYVFRDIDIASMLGISLASVQMWRRKLNMIHKLLDIYGKPKSKANVMKKLLCGESGIRKELYEAMADCE